MTITTVTAILLFQLLHLLLGLSRKLGHSYFGVLIIRDPTIKGTTLGSPIFGNPSS